MRFLLLLALAGPSFAQFNSSGPPGAVVVGASPSGQTCTTATAQAKIYNGTIYTCQSGTYAVVGGGGGTGTATSVGLSMPATLCSVTNSPVTTSGTLTCTFATGQTANLILGSNGSGNVGLMNLTTAQLPSIASTFLSDSSSLVRTTDTGSVTNTMLAGSIATAKISGLSASATTDTTNASNISSGTLPTGRLPTSAALNVPTTASVLASLQGTVTGLYLMTDGSGATLTDASGNGNNGTINNATWVNSSYLNFFGLGNSNPYYAYVSLPTTVWSTAKTVQVWFATNPNYCSYTTTTCGSGVQALMGSETDAVSLTQSAFSAPAIGIGNAAPATYEKFVGPTSLSFVLGSPVTWYRNGQLAGTWLAENKASFAATTNFYLGGSTLVGGSGDFDGNIYAAVYYSTTLTAAQVAQNDAIVRQFLAANKGISFTDQVNYSADPLILIGDSIAAGNGSGQTMAGSVLWYLQKALPRRVEMWNLGQSGDTASNIATTRINSQVQPLVARFIGTNQAVLIEAGTNDIFASVSAATVYASLKSACTAVHSFNNYGLSQYKPSQNIKCIVGTVMAATRNSGTQETVRQSLNSLIRSGYFSGDLGADGIADWGGDPILGNSNNTKSVYYWGDGLHPTSAGNQIIGNIAALAVQTATGFGSTPYTLRVTVPRGDLSATSATTGAVNLLQLNTNQKVCGVTVRPLSPSVGTALSAMTVSIGDSLGTATQYSSTYSVFGAAGNTNFQDTHQWGSASLAGGVVTANFAATGGNVNAVYTDLVVDGTNNAKVTSASYTFVGADVGTDFYVSAGTGWTTGLYHISSVASGAATLDRSPAAVSTTAGSFILGEVAVDLCVVSAP